MGFPEDQTDAFDGIFQRLVVLIDGVDAAAILISVDEGIRVVSRNTLYLLHVEPPNLHEPLAELVPVPVWQPMNLHEPFIIKCRMLPARRQFAAQPVTRH